MNGNTLHTKPITVGELEYLKDILNSLYPFAIDNENVSLPEESMLVNSFNEANNIINKILEFQEVEETNEES